VVIFKDDWVIILIVSQVGNVFAMKKRESRMRYFVVRDIKTSKEKQNVVIKI